MQLRLVHVATMLVLWGCSDAESASPGASGSAVSTANSTVTTGTSTTVTSTAGGVQGTATSSTTATAVSSTGTSGTAATNTAASTTGVDATTSAGGAASTGQTSATASTTGGTGDTKSQDAIEALRAYLAIERTARPALDSQSFASVALTSADAETARDLLWSDHAAFIAEDRQTEASEKAITVDGQTLRYDFTVFGDKPASGRSLFISLHGGGEAAPSVNDEQWENQKVLYQPDEGIYLAPRAPTNTWNLWHEAHIDVLFDRLIQNFIVIEEVDPNRVYVMGYSAGGDGVYQLGPRMADYWAAAAMMAGHPNDAKPDSLRNIGFTIHVGGLDTAYDRNLVAEEWGTLLDQLQAGDPAGYEHYVEVHPDKPHWMDLEDAVAVPWMADFTRDPMPERVVWLQDDIVHERFYWLAVNPPDAIGGSRVEASITGQSIELEASGISQLKLRLSDSMLDLDQPVSVTAAGSALYEGTVERTILTLFQTIEERGDPALVFSAEVIVALR